MTGIGDSAISDEYDVSDEEPVGMGDEDAQDFDSHVCFAAASPVSHAGGTAVAAGAADAAGAVERVYYMGGNGPHSGDRNSSLGLATLRKDGFASVAGTGVMRTLPLLVTGRQLTVTADFASSGGWLQIGVADTGPSTPIGIAANHSLRVSANGTDIAVHFRGGCGGPDFASLLGTNVTLEVLMSDAYLYTVGFAPRAPPASTSC